MVNKDILWQEFIYKELPKICYTCDRILLDNEICKFLELPEQLRAKLVEGLWIGASRVPVQNQTPNTVRRSHTPPKQGRNSRSMDIS